MVTGRGYFPVGERATRRAFMGFRHWLDLFFMLADEVIEWGVPAGLRT